jgi:hypothetical protein
MPRLFYKLPYTRIKIVCTVEEVTVSLVGIEPKYTLLPRTRFNLQKLTDDWLGGSWKFYNPWEVTKTIHLKPVQGCRAYAAFFYPVTDNAEITRPRSETAVYE